MNPKGGTIARSPRFSPDSLMGTISKSPRFTPISRISKLPGTPRSATGTSNQIATPHYSLTRSPRGKWHNSEDLLHDVGAPSDGHWETCGLKSLDDVVEVYILL